MTMVMPEFRLHHYMQLALETSGLGVQEIADRLDVSRNSVSAWINGRSTPSTPVLMAWASVTGVEYEWLCARRDSNPQPSDLYPTFLESAFIRCPFCGYVFAGGASCICCGRRLADALDVELQLLLLVEGVRS